MHCATSQRSLLYFCTTGWWQEALTAGRRKTVGSVLEDAVYSGNLTLPVVPIWGAAFSSWGTLIQLQLKCSFLQRFEILKWAGGARSDLKWTLQYCDAVCCQVLTGPIHTAFTCRGGRQVGEKLTIVICFNYKPVGTSWLTLGYTIISYYNISSIIHSRVAMFRIPKQADFLILLIKYVITGVVGHFSGDLV